MSAKAVEHVRSTQGVVSSIASATKSAKRAGLPVKAAAGGKLARPAPKVTWADKAKASGQKKAAAFDVAALMKRDRSAAPAAPKVTWGQKAAAAKSKGGTVTIAEAARQINNSGMDGKQRLAAKKQLRKRIDRMLANDRRARAAQ